MSVMVRRATIALFCLAGGFSGSSSVVATESDPWGGLCRDLAADAARRPQSPGQPVNRAEAAKAYQTAENMSALGKAQPEPVASSEVHTPSSEIPDITTLMDLNTSVSPKYNRVDGRFHDVEEAKTFLFNVLRLPDGEYTHEELGQKLFFLARYVQQMRQNRQKPETIKAAAELVKIAINAFHEVTTINPHVLAFKKKFASPQPQQP